MSGHRAGRLATGLPRSEREGERRADEERERRLNEVVECAAPPGDMVLMPGEKREQLRLRIGLGHLPELEHLRHHQEHDEATVDVERLDPPGLGDVA